jgi:hypothetical protein
MNWPKSCAGTWLPMASAYTVLPVCAIGVKSVKVL